MRNGEGGRRRRKKEGRREVERGVGGERGRKEARKKRSGAGGRRRRKKEGE